MIIFILRIFVWIKTSLPSMPFEQSIMNDLMKEPVTYWNTTIIFNKDLNVKLL